MPDWSYHTLFLPVLRRLPGARARDLTLAAVGSLASLPAGGALFHVFGHMAPPPGAGVAVLGLNLKSRVGLSGEVDPRLLGTRALAQFGVGLLEIGPVTVDPMPEGMGPRLGSDGRSIVLDAAPASPGLAVVQRRLASLGDVRVPLLVRIAPRGSDVPQETQQLINALDTSAAAFVLDARWCHAVPHLEVVRAMTQRPLLLALPPDADHEALVAGACAASFDGFVISGGMGREGVLVVGPADSRAVKQWVRKVRGQAGVGVAIVAQAGVDSPAAALEFFDAGADIVLLHPGLIAAGPGLPKRINESLAPARVRTGPAGAWLWLALLGGGMVLGGVLAWLIAITTVVLPYDEAFLGLGRDALTAINARLLAFMTHDRVTLAGTMLSIGVLYTQLAVWGVRRRAHWAWQAVMWSAGIGFAGFFLFLGFGYFDPLHATVSVVLFMIFLLALRDRPSPGEIGHGHPGLHNTFAWRLSLWAQLCFVSLGLGLLMAGLSIALVGISGVFVPEDLRFLDAPAAVLQTANPRLLPLVAHDRAGFGGALVSDGVGVLLVSLWGFREGAHWVWWTLLGAGVPGFAAALGVHLAVGYLDVWHLAPALSGLVVFAIGLALSFPFLHWQPAD